MSAGQSVARRIDAPSVVLSAAECAALVPLLRAGMGELSRRGPVNQHVRELARCVVELGMRQQAGMIRAASADATFQTETAEIRRDWITSDEAAHSLGVTASRVRQVLRSLPVAVPRGERGAWRIPRDRLPEIRNRIRSAAA